MGCLEVDERLGWQDVCWKSVTLEFSFNCASSLPELLLLRLCSVQSIVLDQCTWKATWSVPANASARFQ